MSVEPSSLGGKRSGSTRIAFRIARRMALQSRGRSALIALLVAIPVAGLVGITTVDASNTASPAERVMLELGSTEARVMIVASPDPKFTQDPLNDRSWGPSDEAFNGEAAQSIEPEPVTAAALFPAGTRLLSIRQANIVAETKNGLGSFTAVQGQPWDASFAGKWDVTNGSAPANDGEIMVTAATLDRLGATVGSTAVITAPEPGEFTIVGTIRSASLDDAAVSFYGLPGAFDGVLPDDSDLLTEWYLPDTPLTWSQIGDLNPRGATVLSRSVLLDPPPVGSYPLDGTVSLSFFDSFLILLGGFALFEVALLAGAAFTVGARTQQRTLATLASVGGDKRMLFRVMSFGGVILGAVGAGLGTLLGLAGAWIFMQISANGSAARYPGFHLDLLSLLIIAAFAVLAGWCAAAVPARAAGRIDVLGALRGALRPPRPTRRRPVAGIILLALGAIVAVTGGLVELAAYLPVYQVWLANFGIGLIIAGPVIMQLGAVFLAPLILRWAAGLASRFGPGARLATRDVARNPGRSVPALAAIMSCVFVAAFAMSLISTFQVNSIKDYYYSVPEDTAWVSLNAYVDEPPYGTMLLESGPEVRNALDGAFPDSRARLLNSVANPPSWVETPADDETATGSTAPVFAYPRLDPGTACPSDATRSEAGHQEDRTDIRCPTPYYLDPMMSSISEHIWVGDLADFAAILGVPVSDESRATLAAGGAVSTYQQYVVDDTIHLDWMATLDATVAPARSVALAGSVQSPEHPLPYAIFMLTETADSLELDHRPTMVVSSLNAAPTQAQQDQVQGAVTAVEPGLFVQVEPGPQAFGASWSWVLVALTAIIALVTASITIGLARADGHRDNAVLTSLGASPRVRRAFGFWQAVVIVGLGSIIGVLLGLVPSLALSLTRDTAGQSLLPFTPPWLQLALIVVALPAVVAVGGALTAGGNRTRFSNRAAFD
ncbi:FtsX-like permease family protein [Cryobacterium sp. TMS1-20-1]|nr:FtsX-like permease family protein [Cryobacterium sp. TMS1-20-1]